MSTYKNAHQKLRYKCPNGHINITKWNGWQIGYRCPTCYNLNRSGPNSPNWQGGLSFEPYCQDWTEEYKEYIKSRDGFKCLNPDCRAKNPPENLITICRSCNVRANFRRDKHKRFYKDLISRLHYAT